MKEKRQALILEIIRSEEIETQEQLLAALAKRGVRCTQATISRDIKELRLIKEQSRSGRYVYSASRQQQTSDRTQGLQSILREGVISSDWAQNLVVLKTMPALANAAAATLDGMDWPDMVGSIAGDDTVLVIMRTPADAERFCEDLRDMTK